MKMINSIALSNTGFMEMTDEEVMKVEGGLFPIILFGGAVVITKTAAIVAGVIAGTAVVGAGVYVGYKQTTKDLEEKYGK